MAFVLDDRIRENSTTTGAGDITLAGAVSGYSSFGSRMNVGDTTFLCIINGTEWETSLATLSAPNTLTRTTVFRSSNSDILVNFSAGTKDVFCDMPAPSAGMTAAGKSSLRSAMGITGKNRIINGRCQIDQRNAGVATVVASTAYGPDRWKMFGEDNLGKLTGRDTTLNSSRYNGVVTCVTANNKYGVAQIIEGINCKDMRGQTVCLSASLAVSNARLGNIKMGIIEWTGTEDTLTAAMVSSFGADGVTPTLAANYAFINTPANLSVTTSALPYYVRATLGNSFTNLVAFIWNDDKAFTANDAFYFGEVQLELGNEPTPFEFEKVSEVTRQCERYYSARGSDNASSFFSGNTTNGSSYFALTTFATVMRTTPTVALTNADALGFGTTPGATSVSQFGFRESRNATSTSNGAFYGSSYTATAEL